MYWTIVAIIIAIVLIIGVIQSQKKVKEQQRAQILAVSDGLEANIKNMQHHSAFENSLKKQGEQTTQIFTSLNDFIPTKKIKGFENLYIFSVDKNNKKFAFVKGTHISIIPFEKIESVEIIEDGNILLHKEKGNGEVTDGIDEILREVNSLSETTKRLKKVSLVQVKINLKNNSNSSVIIDCFDCYNMTFERIPVDNYNKERPVYELCFNNAQLIVATIISSIMDERNKEQVVNTTQISNVIRTIDDLPLEIRDAISKGLTLHAVKMYKEYAGCSLQEAKDFIDCIS